MVDEEKNIDTGFDNNPEIIEDMTELTSKDEETERDNYARDVLMPDESDKKARNEKKEENPSRMKAFFREAVSWVLVIVIAVAVAYVADNYIIINAHVPSGSMENTIMTGDRMIGLRFSYWFSSPERGDVVIFYNPDNESEKYVKRIIGEPGDTVVLKDSKVYINGSETPLEEDYLKEEWISGKGSISDSEEERVYEVPEGYYFMMGDNRNNSYDAREWVNTYVSEDKIIAKAVWVYWPFSDMKLID